MQRHFTRRNFLGWGVVAILLVVPLMPKFPLFYVPGSQVSLRIEDLLMAAVVGVWALGAWPRRREVIRDPMVRAIGLFWLVGLISLVSAVFITGTVGVHIGFLHWARRVEYMAAFLVGLEAVGDRRQLAKYMKCIMLVLVYVFVYAVGQKYFNWAVITTQNPEYAKGIALRYVPGGHLISTFAGHYDLATFIILVVPMLFLVLLAAGGSIEQLNLGVSRKWSRVIVSGVIVMAMWLLVNAASRISVVSYMGAVCFGLLLVRRYRYVPVVIVVSVLFIGLSSNLIDRYTRIFLVVKERLVQTVEQQIEVAAAEGGGGFVLAALEDRSTSIRLNVEWPRAIRALKKNPMLGTGYSSITLATDNDFLRTLGEVGLLGFAAFGLVVTRVFLELIRAFPLGRSINLEKAMMVGVFSALPGVALNMVFIDILEASKFAILFWLLLGMAVKLARREVYEKKD